MDPRDLFRHLHAFVMGRLTADGLWNYLSEHSVEAECDLDDEAYDAFSVAELVMAEYTGGSLPEEAARARLATFASDFMSHFRGYTVGREVILQHDDDSSEATHRAAVRRFQQAQRVTQTAPLGVHARFHDPGMPVPERIAPVWEYESARADWQMRTPVAVLG